MPDGSSYDPKVIKDFAWHLYGQARTALAMTVLGGVVLGAIAGRAMGAAGGDGGETPGLVLGALAGLFIGLYFGKQRAFALKLQAQVALCQLEIEKNTRARNGS